MDKLKKKILMYRKTFAFIFGIFIISVIFGSVLQLFLSESDKLLVSEYLTDFVSNINNINYLHFLFNGLINNCLFVFILWLLGISVIGGIVVLFLFFLKGFILGFSICSIITKYGLKGIVFSFFYVFPHQIFNILIYGFISGYSLIFSFKILGFFLRKSNIDIRKAFVGYFRNFLFCFFIMVLSVMYESFVWPHLISFICNLLGL